MTFVRLALIWLFVVQTALSHGSKRHGMMLTTPAYIQSSFDQIKLCRYGGESVKCDSANGHLDLSLLSRKVKFLSIKNNGLTVLNKRRFRKLRELVLLDVGHNAIQTFRGVFGRNTKLTYLLADNNRLGSGNSMQLTKVFRANNRLQRVSFRYNGLGFVPSNMFDSGNDLRAINLANNLLVRVFEDTFAILSNMEMVDLHSNKITYVHGRAFVHNSKLVHLDMCDNFIAFVGGNPRLDLTNNPLLRTLEMSSNRLASLAEIDLSASTKLTHLDLSYNQIQQLGLADLRNTYDLFSLNLSHNMIRAIHPLTFAGLKKLHSIDLSRNRLTQLSKSTMVNLRGLQELSLAYNDLALLPEDLFYGNGRLVALDLRGNVLRSWQPNTIYSNYNLRFLDLRDNQFRVDGADYFVRHVNKQNQYDVGDWASDNHVMGADEDLDTARKHQMLSKKVFYRIECLRMSGNQLATQAHQAFLAAHINFWAGNHACEIRNHGEKIFRCGCTRAQLDYTLSQWVQHDQFQ